MPNYNIPAGGIGSPAFALVANQVSTVTFNDDLITVEVITDGTAPLWWRCDAGTPAINDTNSLYIPTLGVDSRQPTSPGNTTVTLISTGTPTVRVQRGDQ